MEDLANGLLEASTIYQPCIIRTEEESSFTHSKSLEEMHRRKQNKMKMLASNVGTSMTLNDTAASFWGSVPPNLLSKSRPSLDAEGLETLLSRPNLDQMASNKRAKIVFWVVGLSPCASVLHQTSKIIERHLLNPKLKNIALVILLAAETRYDLDECLEASLVTTSEPFSALIACFDEAVARACKRLAARKEASSSETDQVKLNAETQQRRFRSKKNSLAFIPAPNVMMLHFLTWAEAVAQSFIQDNREEDTYLKMILSGKNIDTLKNDKNSSDVFHLPSIVTMKRVLNQYFPEECIDRVIGRDEEEEDDDDEKEEEEEEEKGRREEGGEEVAASGGKPDEKRKEKENDSSGLQQPHEGKMGSKRNSLLGESDAPATSAVSPPLLSEGSSKQRSSMPLLVATTTTALTASTFESTKIEEKGQGNKASRKSIFSMFTRTSVSSSDKSLQEQQKQQQQQQLRVKIQDFAELGLMKQRFETERVFLVAQHLRKFVSEFTQLNSGSPDVTSNGGAHDDKHDVESDEAGGSKKINNIKGNDATPGGGGGSGGGSDEEEGGGWGGEKSCTILSPSCLIS